MNITAITAIFFTAALIMFPSDAVSAAQNAYEICENTVIPSLFPFFVCSNLLNALNVSEYLGHMLKPIMRPIFGVSENSALAVIMGIVSGYPVGAKTAANLKDKGFITKSEGEKLLAFCNNSGVLFILGTVGSGMLFDEKAGTVLYIAHIMAFLTAALLMRGVKCEFANPPETRENSAPSFSGALTNGISSSMESVYTISGFVIIFAILLEFAEIFKIPNLISCFGIKEEYAKCILYGFIEPTNGCIAVSNLNIDKVFKCMIISAVIGWSGISVHLQVLGIAKKSGLSARYYLIGKIISASVSPIYTAVVFAIYPNEKIQHGLKQIIPIKFTFTYVAVTASAIVTAKILYKIFNKSPSFAFRERTQPPPKKLK